MPGSHGATDRWPDAAGNDARTLAAKLIERKPELAAAGFGWDYAYAGWFQRLLGLAERGWLAEVFSDSHSAGREAIYLADIRPLEWKGDSVATTKPILPLPPPGEFAVDYQGVAPGDGSVDA